MDEYPASRIWMTGDGLQLPGLRHPHAPISRIGYSVRSPDRKPAVPRDSDVQRIIRFNDLAGGSGILSRRGIGGGSGHGFRQGGFKAHSARAIADRSRIGDIVCDRRQPFVECDLRRKRNVKRRLHFRLLDASVEVELEDASLRQSGRAWRRRFTAQRLAAAVFLIIVDCLLGLFRLEARTGPPYPYRTRPTRPDAAVSAFRQGWFRTCPC
jgi:hypothetical protein